MRWKKTLQLLDVHCEGEVGKVVLSGIYDIPGETMTAKMDYINKENDSLRRFVCLEPRGAVNQTVKPHGPAVRSDSRCRFYRFAG